MSKSLLKSIGTFIILSMLLSAFLFIIAFILVNVKGYILKDVLLIESIIFVVLGGFASISGNPKGLSIKSMVMLNIQVMQILKLLEWKMKKLRMMLK